MQHLTEDPTFDTSLGRWTVISPLPAEVVHDPFEDSDGAPLSGSARVINLSGAAASYSLLQCIPLAGDDGWHRIAGRARVESSSSGDPKVFAVAEYFDSSDCSGTPVVTMTSPPLAGDTDGAWEPFAASLQEELPGWVASVLAIYQVEAGSAASFEVKLDDLVLHDLAPVFLDGFESGDVMG